MKKTRLISSAIALVMVAACAKPQPQAFQVIPQPADVTVNEGTFCVKGAAVSFDENMDEASKAAAQRFVAALETASGVKCKQAEGGISFIQNPNLAAEQYAINVTPKGVNVEASALVMMFMLASSCQRCGRRKVLFRSTKKIGLV